MATDSRDTIWWNKIRFENDLASFQNLHHRYYPLLCEFSYLYLGSRESCEEVVDDIFMMLWQKKSELCHIRNIKSYLYTCTRNLSIDLLRKNNKTIELSPDAFELEKVPYSYELTPDFEMTEFREHLQSAVDQLPCRCKLIFRMLLNDNLKSAEIAEILNLSKKTIETQIAIAYKKLTVALKKVYKEVS